MFIKGENMEDYIQQVLRTEAIDYEKVAQRLQNKDTLRLLHAALGYATESGEFVDMIKRHIFYGKEIDRANGIEELGDGDWYEALAIDVLQTTLDEVQEKNIAKLKIRYPEKFTEEAALNRNLNKEREVLEK
jgi:NTP pyrophosphatase (non-canonical NTP hydrolase)